MRAASLLAALFIGLSVQHTASAQQYYVPNMAQPYGGQWGWVTPSVPTVPRVPNYGYIRPTVPNYGPPVYVRPHVRSNGTFVDGHYRSYPDGNFYNNWSTWPNVNPYTGQRGYRRYPSFR